MLSEGLKLDQLDGAQIAELQNMLVKVGYDPGAVDGIMGPKTKAAYARFLSRQGLSGYQGANNEIVVRLVTQLQDPNAGPELWGGLVHGGETMVPTASNPTGQKPTEAPAPPPAQTTAAPAPTGGGSVSGTPITPIPELSASEQEAAVMSRFPHLAFLLQHPEVRDVLIRATQGGWDQGQLQGEIYKTWWWKLTDASMRVWDAKIFQDPATTQKEWDQKALQVHNKALQLGAPVTHSDAHWLAGRVLREGWSDEQLNSFLGQTIRNAGGASPGLVTDKMAGIKALAGKYLSSMDDAKAQEYAIRITEGSINQEAIETMLRDQAKNRFGWLSERIDQGLSPLDLFDSTRRVVAETLEMDPATINLNDPKWSELTSPVMEGTKQRSMNFAEAQRWARKRAEWRFTDNANKESSQMSLNLLKTMGVLG